MKFIFSPDIIILCDWRLKTPTNSLNLPLKTPGLVHRSVTMCGAHATSVCVCGSCFGSLSEGQVFKVPPSSTLIHYDNGEFSVAWRPDSVLLSHCLSKGSHVLILPTVLQFGEANIHESARGDNYVLPAPTKRQLHPDSKWQTLFFCACTFSSYAKCSTFSA